MKKHMDPTTGETGRCSAKSPETCPVVKDLPAEEQAAFHFDSSHETLLRGALEQRVQARNGWSNVESVRREKPEIEASPEVSAKELLARGASGKSVRDALRAENPEWSHAQVHAVYSSMVKKGAVLDEAKNPKDVGPSNSKPGLATRPVPPESTPPPATAKKPVPKPAPTELNLVSERMQEEYVRTYNGAHGLPRSVTHPHGGVGQAAYELAARITAETKVAAIDYLAIARARDPEESLREHLLSGQAGATFLALSKKHRLDLCIERLTIDLAETYALGDDLVTAAAARLAYFESQ